MQCMKCGREIEPGAVFCAACLEDMDHYPVKPGTVVQLPHRPEHIPAKKSPARRKPSLSPEEQVKKLKKRIFALACALVLAGAVISGLCFLVVRQYVENAGKVMPGQNYSSAVTKTTEPEA